MTLAVQMPTKISPTPAWDWLFAFLIGAVYLLSNLQFHGPAYQADEIGYLVNAAFLSGHLVDGFSSYHAGYSALLAPLFVCLTDPTQIWRGVVLFNALMWAISFFVLARFIRKYAPRATEQNRFLALCLLAMYPAWIAMAGYAFSTSAFVLCFVLALHSLNYWKPQNPLSVLPHSGFVGYLFWIHPTAVAVIAASVLALALIAWRTGHYRFLLIHVLLVLGVAVAYKLCVQPWMMSTMTPLGYTARTHYPTVGGVVGHFEKLGTWTRAMTIVLGESAYMFVATFGFVFVGIGELIRNVSRGLAEATTGSPERAIIQTAVGVFLLSSLIAIAGITATMLAHNPTRLDHWFYGRYIEGVVIPIFLIGLVAQKRNRFFVISAAIATIGFGLIVESGVPAHANLNAVNVQGLWPTAVIPGKHAFLWFLVGAVAGAFAGLARIRYVALPVIASYLLAINLQMDWHRNILAEYSKPAATVDFVRRNFSKGTCVGFDPYLPGRATMQMRERLNLYSFFLFDYGYRRMTPAEWRGSCTGPFFTYEPSVLQGEPNITIVGRESRTGLCLAIKNQQGQEAYRRRVPGRGSVEWVDDKGEDCVIRGCFSLRGGELSKYTQVGEVDNGAISTTSRRGYLFFGPYARVAKGKYQVTLRGDFPHVNRAVLDVVSEKGRLTHKRVDLSGLAPDETLPVTFTFVLEKDVVDLEVRMYVSRKTRLTIRSYKVTALPGD